MGDLNNPNKNNNPDKTIIKVDPATLLVVVVAVLLVPLLLAGFFSQ